MKKIKFKTIPTYHSIYRHSAWTIISLTNESGEEERLYNKLSEILQRI